MKCRDCKYMYNNETMGKLYICVNGKSENFGQYTGICSEDDDIDRIVIKNEIFRIWLDRDCFKSSKWKFICNKELLEMRKKVLNKYNKPIGSDYYQIYTNGKFIRAKREDCIGLEYTAAWTELGVTQRLNYSFFGKELPSHVKKDIPFYN